MKNSSIGNLQDVAKLKLTQNDLILLLDSIAESIYGVDLDGNCTFCNAAFLKILGYSHVAEVIGKSIHQLIHYKYPDGSAYPCNECTIFKAMQHGESTHLNDEVFWKADGSSFPVEYWSYPQYRDGILIGNVVTFLDITISKIKEQRENTRSEILELLYKGVPLNVILNAMVLGAEKNNYGMLCSILLLDKQGKHLVTGAAPSLPEFYNKAIHNIEIGIGVGSCGTSAFTGERVVVEHIQNHPYWKNYKKIAAKANLQSCWSQPISNTKGKVLGTFAIYHQHPSLPSDLDVELIKQYAELAAIVIERYNADSNLKESEEKYRSLIENSPDIIMTLDLNERIEFINFTGGGFSREQIIETKTHQSYETIAIGADNISRWFITNVGPIMSGEKVVGITLITKDITERKHAEVKIAESVSLLEATLESTADGILVVDKSGKIIRFNKKFLELWHIPKEILDARDDKKAIAFVSEQLINPDSFNSKVDELYDQKEAIDFDTLEFKDGRTFERYTQSQMIQGTAVGRVWSFRDVTERRRFERDIIKSEEKYRQIVETAQEGIWVIDENSITTFVNLRMSSMLGYEKAEMIGKELFDFMDEEGVKISEQNILRRKQGITEQYEFKFLKKNGEGIFVLIETTPITEGNVYKGALKMVMDVTQLKLAEREVMLLMNNTEESFVLIDHHLKIVTFNHQFKENFHKYLGKDVKRGDLILDYSQPGRRTILENVYQRVLNGERLETEIQIPQKDNFFTTYLNRFKPSYDINENINGVFVTSIDITERKKVEELLALKENRLRTILETEPECIKQLNEKGELLEMNPAGFAMLEVDDASQILGHQLTDYVHTKYKAPFVKLIKEVFKGNSGKLEFEITGMKGRHRWLETHAVPLKDNEGKIISLLGVTRDITERKIAEEELVKSEQALRHLSAHLQNIREEEGTRIAREIHDELGQQLTGLKMDASWIRKKILTEDKVLNDRIEGMIMLIDDTVKTVRRIAARLRPGVLDDIGIVAAIEWQSNEFAKRAEIKVNFHSKAEELNLDKNLATGIFRIYQEALTNIMKHSGAKIVNVNIASQNNSIILVIHDNGIGYEMESVKYKNTLGLVGMKERAIMLGGQLDIESKLGLGSTIKLTIPIQEQETKKEV